MRIQGQAVKTLAEINFPVNFANVKFQTTMMNLVLQYYPPLQT